MLQGFVYHNEKDDEEWCFVTVFCRVVCDPFKSGKDYCFLLVIITSFDFFLMGLILFVWKN